MPKKMFSIIACDAVENNETRPPVPEPAGAMPLAKLRFVSSRCSRITCIAMDRTQANAKASSATGER